MARPSNREMKVLSHLRMGRADAGPADYADVGERTFAGMLAKGWLAAAPEAGRYAITRKGIIAHEEAMDRGRLRY